MLAEHDFISLKVTAAVCPNAEKWPKPNFASVSLLGDVPHVGEIGDVHWSMLHDCVDDARNRVLKCLGALSGIDSDKSLSQSGRAERKKEIAAKALAEIEKSTSLEKARASVEKQVAIWTEKLGISPKAPESVGVAMMNCEIRSHLASLKAGDRVAFCNAHASEIGGAVLSAPGFLSGLTPAEMAVVRQRVAATTNPKVAEAMGDTLNALRDAERGFRNAAATIREAGGLAMGDGNGKDGNDGSD